MGNGKWLKEREELAGNRNGWVRDRERKGEKGG